MGKGKRSRLAACWMGSIRVKSIFLSASVPIVGRGTFYKSADPFLIQCAVKELVTGIIKHKHIVWGGHPAITPMIWTICQDIGVNYSQSVTLYQSLYFKDRFPEENEKFKNVVFVDAISGDQDASLLSMREKMLSRSDLEAAVFIGGMEGVEVEYDLFKKFHPNSKALLVTAPGGAARKLAQRIYGLPEEFVGDINFANLFHAEFPPPS
jgi:hypothetical protein